MTPARLLAPVALVACAIALFAVVSSGSGDKHSDSSSSSDPVATATATATKAAGKKAKPARTYTVQSGDTPSAIAAKEHVDLQDLLDANPDADAAALHVGQKLKLP